MYVQYVLDVYVEAGCGSPPPPPQRRALSQDQAHLSLVVCLTTPPVRYDALRQVREYIRHHSMYDTMELEIMRAHTWYVS